ncbi:MAG: group III truncated hemoglobin [Moheibacter sp.]
MKDKKDITTLEDVKLLVNTFYGKVREDKLLKDIFDNVIQDRWPMHLEKMYRFWQTVLLGEHTYSGKPFIPHMELPVEQKHFAQWIELFYETVDDNFSGQKAQLAKWQGNRMAEMFLLKIEYFRENTQETPLL